MWDPSFARTLTKYLGLLGTLGGISALYWAFPIYRGNTYSDFFAVTPVVLLVWLAVAPFYLFYVDGISKSPHEGFWHMGRLIILRFSSSSSQLSSSPIIPTSPSQASGDCTTTVVEIRQHVLGWLIKAFFLPMMFSSMCNNLMILSQVPLPPSVCLEQPDGMSASFTPLGCFGAIFDFLYTFLYFLDVAVAVGGYLVSLRLADTHLRSADPHLDGWVAALLCYPPIWTAVGDSFLNYNHGRPWNGWLAAFPRWVAVFWGCAILVLIAIYVWATLIFGPRFSNLTHRGIITNGPYRFLKHPAFLSKNITWWLISVPFAGEGETVFEGLRRCALLCGVNYIYYLRAVTEEQHLSADPVYVQYSRWIERHGLFARASACFKSVATQVRFVCRQNGGGKGVGGDEATNPAAPQSSSAFADSRKPNYEDAVTHNIHMYMAVGSTDVTDYSN